jgi:hypothetical protein
MNARITHYLNHSGVILCELSDGWSWSATHEVFARIEEFAAPQGVPYHIIFDVRKMTGFSSRQFFSQARYLVTHLPALFSGTLVVVGAGDLIRTLVNAVRMLHPRLFAQTHLTFADTVEEAFNALTENSRS